MLIKTPNCRLSKQITSMICIHPECDKYPFICNSCPNEECQKMHTHDNQSSKIKWNQMSTLLRNIYRNQDSYFVAVLKQKVETIIEQIKYTLEYQIQMLNSISCSLQFQPDIQQILNHLKNQEMNELTGNGLNKMYQSLKNRTHFLNSQIIQSKLDNQTQNFKAYLDSLSQTTLNYFKHTFKIQLKDKLNKFYICEHKILQYSKVISYNPQDSLAYFNRALNYQNINKLQEAQHDYNMGLSINPNDESAYNNRGNLHKMLNRIKQAESDYTKAIQINPNYANAYNNRGNLYDDMNKYKQAEEDYKRAIALDHHYADAYYNLGMLYEKQNKFNEAIQYYNKAIELNPNDVESFNNRGEINLQQNKLIEAEKDFTKAIALNPKQLHYYANRLEVYKRLNLLQEVEKQYRAIRQLKKSKSVLY